MDLDDVRELLYSYTKELLTIVEESSIEDLYEKDKVEEIVEGFLTSHEELTGHLEEPESSDEDF